MRYNPPAAITQERLNNWLGRVVIGTDGMAGIVRDAWATRGGSIALKCENVIGETFFTSNEYATIVR